MVQLDALSSNVDDLMKRTARLEAIANRPSMPALQKQVQKIEGETGDLGDRSDIMAADASAPTRRTDQPEGSTDGLSEHTGRFEHFLGPVDSAEDHDPTKDGVIDVSLSETPTDNPDLRELREMVKKLDFALHRLEEKEEDSGEQIAVLVADQAAQKEKMAKTDTVVFKLSDRTERVYLAIQDLASKIETLLNRVAELVAVEQEANVDQQKGGDLTGALDELRSLETRLSNLLRGPRP